MYKMKDTVLINNILSTYYHVGSYCYIALTVMNRVYMKICLVLSKIHPLEDLTVVGSGSAIKQKLKNPNIETEMPNYPCMVVVCNLT